MAIFLFEVLPFRLMSIVQSCDFFLGVFVFVFVCSLRINCHSWCYFSFFLPSIPPAAVNFELAFYSFDLPCIHSNVSFLCRCAVPSQR